MKTMNTLKVLKKLSLNKFVFLLLAGTLFTACSFDKNNPSEDRVKQREEDRDKLVQQYAPIQGKYIGKLEFYDRPQDMGVDVELSLILEEENAGVDADGLPIIRPILKAYFKRSDDLNLGLAFKANYNSYIDPNNQNLVLTNPTVIGEKSSTVADQEITSIRGKIQNDLIESVILSGGGAIGKMTLKLADKSTEASSLGIQSDINEKVLKLYKKVEGTYEGYIRIDASALNPILSRVTLTATLNQTGKPVLKAYYERLDQYPVLDFNQELVVDYKTESYPQKISLVSPTGSGFNFVGTIHTENVCGKNDCPYYLQGELVLSKNIKTITRFVRINERPIPQNSEIIGRYQGKLKLNDRPNQTGPSIELSIFSQEEVGGVDKNGQPIRKPALKAYIKRSDNFSAGSIYSVSYNDLSNPEDYNLVIFNPSNPNLDIISLRGKFTDSVFTAEVLSRNGIIGTVSLKWIDKVPQAPSDNLDNQNSENLLKLYKVIEGSYEGIVTVSTKDIEPFPIRVSINATMTAGNKPVIRAYYQRTDVPAGVLDLDLDVEYKVDTFPQRITMTSIMPAGNQNVYFLNFEGIIRPQNPNTRVDCKAKENLKLSDCRYQIIGTILLPKNRRSEITLIRTK